MYKSIIFKKLYHTLTFHTTLYRVLNKDISQIIFKDKARKNEKEKGDVGTWSRFLVHFLRA